MARIFQYLILALAGGLAFSSCTCHRDAEEANQDLARAVPTRRAASLPTRPHPAVSQVEVPTVVVPTAPPVPVPTQGEVSLPNDFPSDVPVFKDAKAFAVQKLAGNAQSVLFHADAESKEIYQYYRDEMRTKGWNVEQEYQNANQSFLSFRKGKVLTNMTISKDPRTDKRVIMIMYQQEQDLAFPEF